MVAEVLEGDRYTLKSLNNNRTYKYSHENLRKMPECHIPSELDISDDQDSETESETTRGKTEHVVLGAALLAPAEIVTANRDVC